MLGGAETLAEGPVVQVGEEEEKTGVVLRAEESTVVVLWAGAADNSMGAVQGLEPELILCFPLYTAELRV